MMAAGGELAMYPDPAVVTEIPDTLPESIAAAATAPTTPAGDKGVAKGKSLGY